MREIKFRAWDKKDKDIMFSYIPDDQPKREYIIAQLGVGYSGYKAENLVIMQSTGLEDKNGEEIYEGDIIKHMDMHHVVYYDCVVAMYIALPYYISYESFCESEGVDPTDHMLWDFMEPEVIGNIYENPEILREDK